MSDQPIDDKQVNADRVQLELAAKALGKDIDLACYDKAWGFAFRGMLNWWSPLEDDGDAFRLAVALHLLDEHAGFTYLLTEELWKSSNDCAATRRAIVRAAAAIGKEMP